TIIHQNKGDENARGHIGTEINNKSETVLKVEKDNHNESVSTVEAVYIRDITFPSFAFQINSSALPELLLNYEASKDSKGNVAWNPYFDITEDMHRKVNRIYILCEEWFSTHHAVTHYLRFAFRHCFRLLLSH
ncbi:MAG: mobilization protein, partial [Muribaculaceae bacterium]|nr:mobilization protein [Muribaculaceae bacterium]